MASKTTVIKLLEVISKIADSAADRLEDGGKLGKADITALVDTLERIHSSLHQVKSHIYALTNGKKADTDKFKEKVGPLMRMKPKPVKSSLVEAATEKQVRYVMYLLHKAGYSTRWMDAKFKELGATMRERSGQVEDWVKRLDYGRLSDLIDHLKKSTSASLVETFKSEAKLVRVVQR